MKTFCGIAITLFVFSVLAQAQIERATPVSESPSFASPGYETALGLRLGGLNSGFSIKHFTSSDGALEGILGLERSGLLITGLYEEHQFISNAPGLKWFYGAGAHIGFFGSGGGYYLFAANNNYSNRAVVGADVILGLDYKFTGAPVNLGIDMKPVIDFAPGLPVYFDGGLSMRYAF